VSQDRKKERVALAALKWVEAGAALGVGTGSTANCFIDALAASDCRPSLAVASSEATAARLRSHDIRVVDLSEVERLPLYVDGADEATEDGMLIKGGGGALTREKIVAEASDRFVCIVDESKIVQRLGRFPLPVEVIPMALRQVAASIAALGGTAQERSGFVTDNGNLILDVSGWEIEAPAELESELNQIPGVVTNGLFARRPADVVLAAGMEQVERYAG
jgi:ribose 5-phosphate isomerase A